MLWSEKHPRKLSEHLQIQMLTQRNCWLALLQHLDHDLTSSNQREDSRSVKRIPSLMKVKTLHTLPVYELLPDEIFINT